MAESGGAAGALGRLGLPTSFGSTRKKRKCVATWVTCHGRSGSVGGQAKMRQAMRRRGHALGSSRTRDGCNARRERPRLAFERARQVRLGSLFEAAPAPALTQIPTVATVVVTTVHGGGCAGTAGTRAGLPLPPPRPPPPPSGLRPPSPGKAPGFAHHLVAAPMVGASDLAFRLLCRRHGTQLCYTEMLHSDRLVSDTAAAAAGDADCATAAAYLAKYFQTCAEDRPLVAQLCGNDAATLLAAAQLLQARGVDAVDLNLGCPQRHARTHGYGAYLLAPTPPEQRARLLHIVTTVSAALHVPLFCKIRAVCESAADTTGGLRQRGGTGGAGGGGSDGGSCSAEADDIYCSQGRGDRSSCSNRSAASVPGPADGTGHQSCDVPATVQLARDLEAAGCRLLAVHGRTCDPHNGHKRRRKGPADLNVVRAVKEAVQIPVLSNGNVRTRVDILDAAAATGADGVMSACALLENPALFEDGDGCGFNSTARVRRKLLTLGLEYLALVDKHPPPTFQYARAHVVSLLGRRQQGRRLRFRHDTRTAFGSATQLRDAIAAARSTGDLAAILRRCLDPPPAAVPVTAK